MCPSSQLDTGGRGTRARHQSVREIPVRKLGLDRVDGAVDFFGDLPVAPGSGHRESGEGAPISEAFYSAGGKPKSVAANASGTCTPHSSRRTSPRSSMLRMVLLTTSRESPE